MLGDGGEEFVAVLPDADMDAALLIAEQMRMRVAQAKASGRNRSIGGQV
ncbi:MAG: hypothetical protein Q9M26_01080 [Mariprofundales bacterium]|nr:hypothetical protein [Mariprofundales bacterium]